MHGDKKISVSSSRSKSTWAKLTATSIRFFKGSLISDEEKAGAKRQRTIKPGGHKHCFSPWVKLSFICDSFLWHPRKFPLARRNYSGVQDFWREIYYSLTKLTWNDLCADRRFLTYVYCIWRGWLNSPLFSLGQIWSSAYRGKRRDPLDGITALDY